MRLVVLFAFLLPLSAAQAAAADLYVKYKLYALALPIGEGVLNIDIGESAYSVSGNGRTAAFGKLVSDGKGTVKVSGKVDGASLAPESFSYKVNSEGEDASVSMKLRGRKVGETVVKPPQDRMKERVKVTQDHLSGILDPLSAAVFPAPAGLKPESCDRTLPLFDGKERYNVRLSYKERRKAKTSDGRFNGDVIVCRARYEPVSGHRKGRKSIQQLADNTSMEIWLAPVGGGKPYLFPIRASITAPFGPLVVQAEKYKFSG